MELQHIWAITLRHIHLWRKDLNLIAATLYWPFLDVFIWGFMGTWLQKQQTANLNYQLIFLMCILLWQTISRNSVVITTCFLEEIYSYNLINMFSLPLRISEWIVGIILFAFLISVIIVCYCMLLIILFYQINIFTVLQLFSMFAPPLFISGIWIGFMTLQIVASFGKRAQEFTWILAWFFAPLSGVFYSIEVFPDWLQKICYWIPMTHVFEGLRNYLMHGTNPRIYLWYAYGLSIPYALLAIVVFVWIFNRTKVKGLARLSD